MTKTKTKTKCPVCGNHAERVEIPPSDDGALPVAAWECWSDYCRGIRFVDADFVGDPADLSYEMLSPHSLGYCTGDTLRDSFASPYPNR